MRTCEFGNKEINEVSERAAPTGSNDNIFTSNECESFIGEER
jgi:hypothetical protein